MKNYTFEDFQTADDLGKIDIIRRMMWHWDVVYGDVEWAGKPTVHIIKDKLSLQKTSFLDNPRYVQVNIAEISEEQFNDLAELGEIVKIALPRILGKVIMDKTFDSTIKFLEPIDWAPAMKRWRTFYQWLVSHFKGYEAGDFGWEEAQPKNMVAWGARHILGGIGVSDTLRKNIHSVEFQETGIAKWKQGTLWTEYLFRDRGDSYKVLGWSGAMTHAINSCFSTADENTCRCSKVPEKWEEEEGIFVKVVPNKKK
jgi:hypothetical protein